MNPSQISLGSIREQTRQRADIQNNNFITDAELNQYISQSWKILYDKLVAAYGNDYFVSYYYQFSITNLQYYPLPDGSPNFQLDSGLQAPKFYKLIGVDLQYSSSPSGYVTLRRFEEIERNKYGQPNTAINYNGYSNLRYRLSGNNIEMVPVPMAGQSARIKYIPATTPLQYLIPVATVSGQATSSSSFDTTGLSIGMNAFGSALSANTNLSSLSSTSVTFSSNALSTSPSSMIYLWNDFATLDGINGWEEFVIIDSAIKCKIKSEEDISGLAAQRMEIVQHLEGMAEGRDVGEAMHVSDALGAQGFGGDGGWFGGGGMDY